MPTVIWVIVFELVFSVLNSLYRAGQGGYYKTPTDYVIGAIEMVALVVWLLVVFL